MYSGETCGCLESSVLHVVLLCSESTRLTLSLQTYKSKQLFKQINNGWSQAHGNARLLSAGSTFHQCGNEGWVEQNLFLGWTSCYWRCASSLTAHVLQSWYPFLCEWNGIKMDIRTKASYALRLSFSSSMGGISLSGVRVAAIIPGSH